MHTCALSLQHGSAATAVETDDESGGGMWVEEVDESGRILLQLLETTADDWMLSPELLLGERIAMRWAGRKWYEGTVDKYDSANKLHHVSYDDGDERWYTMTEKTFMSIKAEGNINANEQVRPYFAYLECDAVRPSSVYLLPT